MKNRIIALLSAAALLMLPACGTAAQQAGAPIGGETEAALHSTAPVSGEESTASEPESTTGIDETTAEGETTAVIEIKAPVGGSAAQIVEFYNTQASAVKAADRITVKKHDVRETAMDVPTVIKALMPEDTGGLNKNETITEIFVNGKGTKDSARRLNDFLPVAGQPYVSRLKASHVQSAGCAAQGEGWIVTIKLKDEPLDMSMMSAGAENMSEADRKKWMNDYLAKSGYGSSMDMGIGDAPSDRGGSQEFQPPAFIDTSSIIMEGGYQNGTIVAVFGRDGQLTSLTLSYENNMSTSLIGMKIQVNSTLKQDYQFTW